MLLSHRTRAPLGMMVAGLGLCFLVSCNEQTSAPPRDLKTQVDLKRATQEVEKLDALQASIDALNKELSRLRGSPVRDCPPGRACYPSLVEGKNPNQAALDATTAELVDTTRRAEMTKTAAVQSYTDALKGQIDERLRAGRVAYNAPTTASVGHPFNVVLSLGDAALGEQIKAEMKRELVALGTKNPEKTQQFFDERVAISDVVSAELSGSQFEITTIGPREQLLRPGVPATWNWQVLPKMAGKQSLGYAVYATIRIENADRSLKLKTYSSDITVSVDMWSWLPEFAKTWGGAIAAIGSAIATISAGIVWWRRRRKKKRAKRSDDVIDKKQPPEG